MHFERVIPYNYLNKRLSATAVFRKDKIGATNAIKKAIQTLVEVDYIREANKQDLVKSFGTGQRSFVINNLTEMLGISNGF